MTIANVTMLATLPVLLVLSAFFSGSETALFSLTRHERARLARSGRFTDGLLSRLLSETRALLITLLLGNMTINVLFFVISSMLLLQLRGVGGVLITLASVLPLLTIILLGEVLPKLVASRLRVSYARVVSVPLWTVHRVFSPIRLASQHLVITPLARLIEPPNRPPELSTQELESLLALSQRHGVIDPGEERLLQQVLDLGQLKVCDLMVPRVDIQAYDLEDDPARLIELVKRTQLRHLPVYRGTLDELVGMVYSRQVLLHRPTTREDVRKLIRQVKFVPEQQRGDQLLVELRKSGATLAMVVDEYGGTAGLITIEDVVEQMVGEIPGPYETAAGPLVEPIGSGAWRVSASLPVAEWAEFFGHSPAVQGVGELQTVRTIGGLVMARLGRVPQPGDQVTLGNVVMTVEQMTGNRVRTVRINLRNDQPDASATPNGGGV